MRIVVRALVPAAMVVLVVSGCASSSEAPQDPILEAYGLDGLDVTEIVTTLDQTQDDREQGLAGSVGYDTLTLSGAEGEAELALPEDLFYLSVAPYVETTHECYYHNLASCQGELAGEDLDVTITDSTGEVLVDESVTAYDNGFVGFWLPKDIEATISVTHDGLTAEAPIATGLEDPTCVTTLQLS